MPPKRKFVDWLKARHILHSWGKWRKWQGTSTPVMMGLPVESAAVKVTRQQRFCSVCKKRENRPL